MNVDIGCSVINSKGIKTTKNCAQWMEDWWMNDWCLFEISFFLIFFSTSCRAQLQRQRQRRLQYRECCLNLLCVQHSNESSEKEEKFDFFFVKFILRENEIIYRWFGARSFLWRACLLLLLFLFYFILKIVFSPQKYLHKHDVKLFIPNSPQKYLKQTWFEIIYSKFTTKIS